MTAYDDGRVSVHLGDCLDVLRSLPDASVDSVVTDPPYGLGFMGKEWDSPSRMVGQDNAPSGGGSNYFKRKGDDGYTPGNAAWYGHNDPRAFQQWCELWATECLRVLKPGGHMLAFGGTRTWHRLACAVEDAGFEVRDSIAWLYGSGFPKSLDVSKAIDKAAGALEHEGRGFTVAGRTDKNLPNPVVKGYVPPAPATPDAERWQGWGTALKPAFEPVVVARKPLQGTVAANVLAWGTGALNIDACRIAGEPWKAHRATGLGSVKYFTEGETPEIDKAPHDAGRWPANVVLDESQAAALDEMSGEFGGVAGGMRQVEGKVTFTVGEEINAKRFEGGNKDFGGASRFFYVARRETCATGAPSASSVESGTARSAEPAVTSWPDGDDQLAARFMYAPKADASERPRVNGTSHPTVKPLALMRWLVRLVTPPGGTVLEPFAGSGTTVEACIVEGFHCLAIEREADYLPLILSRIHRQRDPIAHTRLTGGDLGLFELDGETA